MNKEAIFEVKQAKAKYEHALQARVGLANAKNIYSNVLINNIADLLEAIEEGIGYEEQLNLEIQDSMKLRNEVKALKEQLNAEAPASPVE